jgi:hypothetical protein
MTLTTWGQAVFTIRTYHDGEGPTAHLGRGSFVHFAHRHVAAGAGELMIAITTEDLVG